MLTLPFSSSTSAKGSMDFFYFSIRIYGCFLLCLPKGELRSSSDIIDGWMDGYYVFLPFFSSYLFLSFLTPFSLSALASSARPFCITVTVLIRRVALNISDSESILSTVLSIVLFYWFKYLLFAIFQPFMVTCWSIKNLESYKSKPNIVIPIQTHLYT